LAAAAAFDSVAPQRSLDAIFALLGAANQYVDRAAPWAEAKKGDLARVGTILAVALEAVEIVSLLLWPVMPGIADQIRGQLGLGPVAPRLGEDQWPIHATSGQAGRALGAPNPLFPRIDKDKEAALIASLGIGEVAAPPTEQTAPCAVAAPQTDATQIAYDDFAKIDLRLGIVVAAERIKGKDKLLSLKVDLGESEPRPLVAGIALQYSPEEMVGRRIVVVANLAPRKFGKGLVSHGMLLCAKEGDKLTLVTPVDALPAGSKIS
jgi:methionyl-tRNA synthetase